jgi:hypothetical protein
MGFVLGAGLVVAGLVLLVVIAAVRRKPARKE